MLKDVRLLSTVQYSILSLGEILGATVTEEVQVDSCQYWSETLLEEVDSRNQRQKCSWNQVEKNYFLQTAANTDQTDHQDTCIPTNFC